MNNTTLGLREQILKATTQEEAFTLFEVTKSVAYPPAYVARCKRALKQVNTNLDVKPNAPVSSEKGVATHGHVTAVKSGRVRSPQKDWIVRQPDAASLGNNQGEASDTRGLSEDGPKPGKAWKEPKGGRGRARSVLNEGMHELDNWVGT